MVSSGSDQDPRPEALLENFRRRKEIGLIPGHVKFPVATKRFMLEQYRPCDALSQVVPRSTENSPRSGHMSPRFAMSPRNQTLSPRGTLRSPRGTLTLTMSPRNMRPSPLRRSTQELSELTGDRFEYPKSAADKKRDVQRAELHSWVGALREQRARREDVDGEMISRRLEAANTLRKAHESELKVLQHNRDIKEAEKESEQIRKQLANIARRTNTLKSEKERVSSELNVRMKSQNAAAAAGNKGVTSLRKQLRQFGDDLFDLASVCADTSNVPPPSSSN